MNCINLLDINAKNEQGESQVYQSCEHGKKEYLISLLSEEDVDVNCATFKEYTPLRLCIRNGLRDELIMLLKHSSLDLCVQRNGNSVIYEVINHGSYETLSKFILIRGQSYGIHPHTWNDAYGTTHTEELRKLVGVIAACPDNALAKLLTKYMTNPDLTQRELRSIEEWKAGEVNDDLWIDLYNGIKEQNTSKFQWVVKCMESGHKFSINQQDKHNIWDTVLHAACRVGRLNMIWFILNQGINVKIANKQGRNARDVWIGYHQKEVLDILKALGKIKLDEIRISNEIKLDFWDIIQTPEFRELVVLGIPSSQHALDAIAMVNTETLINENNTLKSALDNSKTLADLYCQQVQDITIKYQCNERTTAQILEANIELSSKIALLEAQLKKTVVAPPSSVIFPSDEIDKITDHFNENNKIGEGACAKVYKGMLRGIPVAIKKFNDNAWDIFKGEGLHQAKYRHPHILMLLGESKPCLIFPLMPRGSVRDRLDCNGGTEPLRWDARIKIALQMAIALDYLHSQSLVHCDVKTENILLDAMDDAKLCDFGIAKQLTAETRKNQPLQGTPGYICPDFMKNGNLSEKTDVFAFGIVMFELLSAKNAVILSNVGTQNLSKVFLSAMKSPGALFNPSLLDCHVQNMWPRDNYQSFAQLARQCIEIDPRKRPTMASVAEELQIILEQKQRVCTICMDNPPNAKFACGHAVCCSPCADYLKRRNEGCPVCRTPITGIQTGIYNHTFMS
jgi:ankyrin repeat protein